MAFPTASVLDNFNRADGAIGSNWLAAFGDNLPAILSNQARRAASGWVGAVWAPSGSVATFAADCEANYELVANDASAQTAAILARVQNPTTGSYNGYGCALIGGFLHILRFTAGASTFLNSAGGAITPAAGDKIGIECVGTAIRLYYAPAGVWPGAPNLTATDATYATGGAVAVSWNQTGSNSNGMDNFAAGSISSGTTYTRSGTVTVGP